jgi:hypothetical protein
MYNNNPYNGMCMPVVYVGNYNIGYGNNYQGTQQMKNNVYNKKGSKREKKHENEIVKENKFLLDEKDFPGL